MCQQVSALDTILHDDPSSRSGALVDWVRLDAVLDLIDTGGTAEQARADEREKIGDAIASRRTAYMLNEAGTGTALGAFAEAEEIARNGGSDDRQ